MTNDIERRISMPGVQKSFRLPPDTLKEIEQISKETGKDLSTVTKDLLTEAIKMRRCPGILFSEGTTGRKARVAGTGIEVWEIIATHRSVGQSAERLRKAYHWLSAEQLRAAIGYYRTYPEEIDQLIDQNEGWTEKSLKERYPFMSSRS
jgi:uncharacterized protein (DUF433 family)